MKRYLRLSSAAIACMLFLGNLAIAQAPAPPAQAPQSTVKLLVVLSRYDGDKKLGSAPYTLSLVPGVNGSLRAGAELAVPTTSAGGIAQSYTMQQLGSQIDASVN